MKVKNDKSKSLFKNKSNEYDIRLFKNNIKFINIKHLYLDLK